MPQRTLIAARLAELLGILAHPQRIRIIEELRGRELNVHDLQAALEASQSRVSQHLSLLRAGRLVAERREGRMVFYRLRHPKLANWITEAMDFIEEDMDDAEQVREAIATVRRLWSASERDRRNSQRRTGRHD